MASLSTIRNEQNKAAAIIIALIAAVNEYSNQRIVSIEQEDGSGYCFNVTCNDMEHPTFRQTRYFVRMNEDFDAKITYTGSRYRTTSGAWNNEGGVFA